MLKQRALTIGHQVMRQLLSAQWKIADQQQDERDSLTIEKLRQLGPEIQTHQTIVATDDILARRPQRRCLA